MNSLADAILIGAPTPERRKQAEAWVDKALSVIKAANDMNAREPEGLAYCEIVLAAALFNKGSLREVRHPYSFQEAC